LAASTASASVIAGLRIFCRGDHSREYRGRGKRLDIEIAPAYPRGSLSLPKAPHDMNGWSETYRGTVPPWECDITEHFTIAYYLDRLTDAERDLADLLELGDLLRGAGFHRRYYLRIARELRAGSSFHIESAALSVRDGLRLGHRFVDSADGTVVTWIEARWDLSGVPLSQTRQDAIGARIAAWEGPEIEERPDPPSRAGFLATARGRVKPGDLDADGRFSLSAIVHRFTDATVQTGAAIGMDAEFLAVQRRGMSTFELALTVSGVLTLDAPYLVETGIAHFGGSSIRLVHVMTDPRDGREVARMSQYAVNLDLDARRPAKWPDDIRARALPLVVPAG
jgi:acyl-CoA thioesterase FadM